MNSGKILFISIIFLSCFSVFSGCHFFQRQEPQPTITLAYQERMAYRFSVLIRERLLIENVSIQSRTDLPYSHNASAAIWVGKNYPYEDAIRVISASREYYQQIRYIALSDYAGEFRRRVPEAIHYELFIGGPTDAALRMGLRAWSDADFEALQRINSEEEFRTFIQERYE